MREQLSQSERRLAAIMFTDMIGYTALGQRNEFLSLALLKEQRKLIRQILARHNGREVKTIGDAFLAEFPNALDSTRCAYDIQRATREFNVAVSEERKIHLRVGLHLGDVVESQGDISGDAVNIASRIQHLAEDGGVSLTRQVFDHVQNKFELPLLSLGLKSLKNVSLPVEVYKVVMPWEQPATAETPAHPANRIAILPFASFSLDPNDGFFADGITDEIISAVAGISGLDVISRTSVAGYKRTTKKVEEIGRELRVGSILEGSFKKAGNKIRVTAQLIEVAGDRHLWSGSYNREFQNIFAIQSDIAKRVAKALKIKLLSRERRDIERKPTENTEAYTLYLKGRYYWNERTKEGNYKAVKYFEEAAKLDPKYALAYAGLADCYIVYSDYGWLRPREAYPKAKEYAMKAIEIDPRLAEAHASLGSVYEDYEWRWDEGEKEFKRAIELKPSYATAYHWYSRFLLLMGRPNEAYEQIKRASVLDPLSRIIGANVGIDLFFIGKVKEAIEHMEKVIEAYPDYPYVRDFLGLVYHTDSRTDEGISELRKAVDLSRGDPVEKADLACLLGLSGRRDEAGSIIEELVELSKTKYVDNWKIAYALFGAGRTDEAFSYLEKGYEERSIGFLRLRLWPWTSELRKDQRWVSLEKRMGVRGA